MGAKEDVVRLRKAFLRNGWARASGGTSWKKGTREIDDATVEKAAEGNTTLRRMLERELEVDLSEA